jgi:hypothetical protein
MSPASYLTAPPRVAGRIVAHPASGAAPTTSTIRRMLVWVWPALALDVLAVIGGVAFATVRGLSAYRITRTVGGELTAGVDRIARDSDELATKLEKLADSTGRLDEALTRLSASRARLNVLLAAIAQVRAALARVTGVMPRK